MLGKVMGADDSLLVTIDKSTCKYPVVAFLFSTPIFSKTAHLLMKA
jgi:hypothetical protein